MVEAPTRLAICCLAAFFAAVPSVGLAARNHVVSPDWIAKPNGEEVGRAYPALARSLGIEGSAILHCAVNELGVLHDCGVENETPAGLGFGAAVLSMAPLFQLRPKLVDGRPTEGGDVRIPIAFRLAVARPPLPEPQPAPPEAVELAKRLLEPDSSEATQLEAAAGTFAAAAPAGGSLSDDILRTVLTAGPIRMAQAKDEIARRYAAAFTLSQLQDVLTFFQSPIGQALRSRTATLDGAGESFRRIYEDAASRAAQESFCASRDCSGEAVIRGLIAETSAAKPTVTIVAPQWASAPSAAEVAAAYPEIARPLRLSAVVRLDCRVSDYGGLTDCGVADEAPRGLRFGAAALSLQGHFRLAPKALAQGAGGETVAVLVRFAAPGAPPHDSPPPEKPRSPGALALAREMVEEDYDLRRMFGVWREAAERSGNDLSGVDLPAYQAALEAGTLAGRRRIADLRAVQVASLFSDAEMGAINAFWRSSSGKAWKAKSTQLAAEAQLTRLYYYRQVMADAGRAYCQRVGCRTGAVVVAQPASTVSSAPSTRTP